MKIPGLRDIIRKEPFIITEGAVYERLNRELPVEMSGIS